MTTPTAPDHSPVPSDKVVLETYKYMQATRGPLVSEDIFVEMWAEAQPVARQRIWNMMAHEKDAL